MDRHEGLLIEQAGGTRKPRTGCCRRPRSSAYPFVPTVQADSTSSLASCQFSFSPERQTVQERKRRHRVQSSDFSLEECNGLIDSASSIENDCKGNAGVVEHVTEVCDPLALDRRALTMGDGDSKNEWKIFQRRVKRKDVHPPETDATDSSFTNVRDTGYDSERAASIKRGRSCDGTSEYECSKKLETVVNDKPPSYGNCKESLHDTNSKKCSGSGSRRSASQSHDQTDDGYLFSGDGSFRRRGDRMGKHCLSGHQYRGGYTDYRSLRRASEGNVRIKNGGDGSDAVIEKGLKPFVRNRHKSVRKVCEPEKLPLGDQSSAKLNLKVGSVSHTLLSNVEQQSSGKEQFSRGTTSSLRTCSNAPGFRKQRQRLFLQDNSDDDDNGFHISFREQSSGKDVSLSNICKVQSNVELNESREAGSGRMCTSKSVESSAEALLAVRKSSRVPKKRILDGDKDIEPEPKQRQRKTTELAPDSGQCCIEEENDVVYDFEVEGASEFQGCHKRQCKKKDELSPELLEAKKEFPLTARQRALKCSKEGGDPESGAHSIEFPEGLPHRITKKQREHLSEAEEAIKKEEAARKRKQQSEKHDKETQDNAIQKILGQDSSRKKREEKIQKQQKAIEQEKQAAAMIPASNSIRWVMGPSGNVVSFSQDVDLPMIFSGPCSYPQEREKCAAPSCNNTYKYRDSRTRLPLCSLQCYRAMQLPPDSASAF